MQTSLQAIANKAARDKRHRFSNLFMMLNLTFILSCWRLINKRAAAGVDRVSAREYEKDLGQNVKRLVERVKGESYRAKLVRRQYIPKGEGKQRPLGIPATEDKLLQKAVAEILGAIYEQDFLPSSYGYRPGVGPKDAARQLAKELQNGKYKYIVEADIRGYYDSIDHEKLVEMLKQRIDDGPFLRLIEKWLKAGVLDTNGEVIDPTAGVPQGGVVSPVLSNVYLHHVLDKWFEDVVKAHCQGEAYLCRFADDFVCAFQYKEEAQRFYEVLGKRLEKFGLKLATEKTKIISFSRFNKQEGNSFEFLGFEYKWEEDRKGRDFLRRLTSGKKLRKSIAELTDWLRKNRSRRLKDIFAEVNAKLRGHYNYYGVIGNYGRLKSFYRQAEELLKKWLNRRSQRKSYNWQGFGDLLKHFNIERPKITEKPWSIAAAAV